MKIKFSKLTLLALCSMVFLNVKAQPNPNQYPGYTLVWSDEFDGYQWYDGQLNAYGNADANTGLDLDTWNYELGNGDGGWGTSQFDESTSMRENVDVSGGTLKINTQKNHPNQQGIPQRGGARYSSGRINSQNKRAFLYGKMEARIRTIGMNGPGQGFAFWMMPNEIPAGKNELMWPQGGEIDIFEYNGMYKRYNLGSTHYAYDWNNNEWRGEGNHAHAGGVYDPLDRGRFINAGRDNCQPGHNVDMYDPNDTNLGANWHTYGINWYSNRIEFFVDGDVFHTFYIDDEQWCGYETKNGVNSILNTGYDFGKNDKDTGIPHNNFWRAFENPFYFILSAGVGGPNTYGGNIQNWVGAPNQWTCTVEIDYVRAYKFNNYDPPQIELDLACNGNNITAAPMLISGNAIKDVEYILDVIPVNARNNGTTPFTFAATQPTHKVYARARDNNNAWGDWTMAYYSNNGCQIIIEKDPCNIFANPSNPNSVGAGHAAVRIDPGSVTLNSDNGNGDCWVTLRGDGTLVSGGTNYTLSGSIRSNKTMTVDLQVENAGDNQQKLNLGAGTAYNVNLTAGQTIPFSFTGTAVGSVANPNFVFHFTNGAWDGEFEIINLTLKPTSCNSNPTPKPAQPSVITQTPAGVPNVGETYTYSVVDQADADTYNWSVTGGTILTGVGTNEITVRWDTHGANQVAVTPRNAGGTGPNRTLAINISMPEYDYWLIYGNPTLEGTVYDCRGTWAVPGWDSGLQQGTECDDGVICLEVKGDRAGWGGGQIPSSGSYDLNAIKANYVLRFDVRSTITGNMKIVIGQTGGDNPDEASFWITNTSGHGYTATGQWQTVEIPLSSFQNWTNTNNGEATLFAAWEFDIANNVGKKLEINNVYYYKTASCNLTAGITGNAAITCANPTVTLTATSNESGVTYAWSGGGNSATKAVTTGGVHTVTITKGNCSATASVEVQTNNANPTVQINGETSLTCERNSIVLTPSSNAANATYTWTNHGGVTGNLTVTAPGTYTVDVVNTDNGCRNSASVTIQDQKETLAVSISGNTPLTCTNRNVTLQANHANGAVTYAWTGGGNTQTKAVTVPGIYTVTITKGTCTATASTTVTENKTAPTVTITGNQQLDCTTPSIVLTAGGNNITNYAWSSGATTQTLEIAAPGTYTVKVVNGNDIAGCTATASTTVTEDTNKPVIGLTATGNLDCTTTQVTLNASNGFTNYSWKKEGQPITGNGTTITVIAPGIYEVSAQQGSCAVTNTVTVTENKIAPTVTITGNQQLDCITSSIILTAGGNNITSYEWTGGAETSTLEVSAAGTYRVKVVNGNDIVGCVAAETVTVTANTTPITTAITGNKQLDCITSSIVLTAAGNSRTSYVWSGVGTGTGSTRTVTQGGIVSVVVTYDPSGCTATESVTVTENKTAPTVVLAGIEDLTCAKPTIVVTANATNADAYVWSGVISSTGNMATVAAAGTVGVTVTNTASQCTESAVQIVGAAQGKPTLTITGGNQLTCNEPTITLSANTNAATPQYTWGGAGTGAGAALVVTSAGTYNVTVVDAANGCDNTTSVVVTNNIETLNVTISGVQELNCQTTAITLSANTAATGVTYTWSAGSNVATQAVTVPDTYTVTITKGTCSATDNVVINQNITAPAIISFTGVKPLTCAEPTIIVTANATDADAYVWSGVVSSTGNMATVNAIGEVAVTVTNTASQCNATSTVLITETKTPPTVGILGAENLTCVTTAVTLTVTSNVPGATFHWSGSGEITAEKVVTGAGTYNVIVTDPVTGCTAPASSGLISEVKTMPDIGIANDGLVLSCTKSVITLTATSDAGEVTYRWNTGETTAEKVVDGAETYIVVATYGTCSAEDRVEVTLNNELTAVTMYPQSPVALEGQNITLSADVTGTALSYEWYFEEGILGGETNAELILNGLTIANAGKYTVKAINGNCVEESSVVLTVNLAAAPVIEAQSASQTVVENTQVTLSVSTSTLGVDFEWKEAAAGVVGGNSNELLLNNATCGIFTYQCTLTANAVASQTSPIVITVIPAQPAAIVATNESPIIGQTVTYSVPLNAGATYNWTIPAGGNIIGDATGNIIVVQWTTNVNGTISVAAIKAGQNSTAQTLPVVVGNIPVPEQPSAIEGETSPAVGTLYTYSVANVAGVTYTWSVEDGTISGAQNTNVITVTFDATGTKVIEVTPSNASGNGASSQLTVTVTNAAPTAMAITASTAIQVGDAITLTASASGEGLTYAWAKGITPLGETSSAYAIASATSADAGEYVCIISNDGGSVSASMTLTVNAADAPQITTQPEDPIATVGDNVTLSIEAEAGSTYQWYDEDGAVGGATESTFTINNVTKAEDGTTYYCVVTKNGSTSTSRTVTLIVHYEAPTAMAITANTVIQEGDAITLTASAAGEGLTYAWSKGITPLGETSSAYAIASATSADAGEYVCIISNDGGSVSASMTLTVSAIDCSGVTVAIAPVTFELSCAQPSIELTANATDVTFEWSTGGTNQTLEVTTASTYSVTVTGTNGCTATDAVNITQDAAGVPTVDIQSATTELTCATPNIVLTVIASATDVTYSWSNLETGSTITVATPSTYSVTVTNTINGCVGIDNITIGENRTQPTVNITPATFELSCAQPSVILTATTNGNTYLWSTGGTNQTLEVTTASTYSVTVTGTNGCVETDDVTIGQDITEPTVSVTKSGDLTCTVRSIQLNAQGNAVSYVWNDMASTTGATLNVTASGNYVVTAFAANGCSATDNITVDETLDLTVGIEADVAAIKMGENITLSTSVSAPVTSYAWSRDGLSLGAVTPALLVEPTTTGTFTYGVTVANGACSDSDAFILTVNPADAPIITTEPVSQTVTVGDNVQFTIAAEAGSTYQWYNTNGVIAGANGTTLPVNNVTKAQNGMTYYCVVTKYGSTSTSAVATLTVLYAAPSNVTVTPLNPVAYPGNRVEFTVQAIGEGLSYQWYKEGNLVQGAVNQTYAIPAVSKADEGAYTCEVSNEGGMDVSNATTLSVRPDKPSAIQTNNNSPKEGDAVDYSINEVPGITYEWTLSDGTPMGAGSQITIDWTEAGTYTLLVTPIDAVGRGESASIQINVIPVVEITISTLIEEPEVEDKIVYRIDQPQPGVIYTWIVTGGRVIEGQGGSLVKVEWLEHGDHSIEVIPTKKGLDGDSHILFVTVSEKEPPITSIDNPQLKISIYPNPTQGEINIDIPEEELIHSISLYEANGRFVRAFEDTKNRKFSLEGLIKGVYLLNIKTETGSYVNRIILY